MKYDDYSGGATVVRFFGVALILRIIKDRRIFLMKKCRKCRRKAVYIGYGMRYCARCYARIYGVWED